MPREVTILCEGPTCNNGIGADDREAAKIRSVRAPDEGARQEAYRAIRAEVTRSLPYTPHVRVYGVDHYGRMRFACTVCQHERVYGTLGASWDEGGPYA